MIPLLSGSGKNRISVSKINKIAAIVIKNNLFLFFLELFCGFTSSSGDNDACGNTSRDHQRAVYQTGRILLTALFHRIQRFCRLA